MSRTFAVSNVPPGKPIAWTIPFRNAVQRLVGPVESCSDANAQVLCEAYKPGLLLAAHSAFTEHYPLALSPDAVWLTLLHGLATHLHQDPEGLRSRLVGHEGKASISVRRDDFVKGRADNPWPEAFSMFSEQIREFLADGVHSLLVPSFSTTGPVERAAFEVALLDATHHYFELTMVTLCGIPSITLEGSTADWESLQRHAAQLERFDLGWWSQDLHPILGQFVDASKGHVDERFWQSIYKVDSRSGGDFISGWLARFLPYVRPIRGGALSRNPLVGAPVYEVSAHRMLEADALSPVESRVPFTWEVMFHRYDMEFVSGLMAVEQDPGTLAIRPRVGWAVRERKAAGTRA